MNKAGEQEQQPERLITKESLRPPCKRTRSRSRCETPQQKEEVKESEPTVAEPKAKPKCRRQWEQWGEDDQEVFFQGLAEYGKDYKKIQTFMTSKLKSSKSADEMKTHEQIRHFYHRTWAKISKTFMLQHEQDPKKAYRREIHYMLCLGELRRKGLQGLGQKILKQLDELVTKGYTYIRYRGRNVRLRPPNRFLKKLYRDVNSIPDVNVPKSVQIEFLPSSNSSFNYVQKHAYNPRLRFTGVNTNAKLSEVFDMLNKRFTDLYSNETLQLLLYPLHKQTTSPDEFAEKIADADELLESCFQRSEAPIVLENATKQSSPEKVESPHNTEDDNEAPKFPRIFGTDCYEKEKQRNVKPFAGYWTRETAEEINIKTLYVALGQIDSLKFKYEWKNDVEKNTCFSAFALDYLNQLCKEDSRPKEIPIAPKLHMHTMNVIPNSNRFYPRGGRHNIVLPRCKRGRGKKNLYSQQSVLRNRIIAPRLTPTNEQMLNNAVAVSLIPHSQDYMQYGSVPPESLGMMNNVTPYHSVVSPLSTNFTPITPPSNQSTESVELYEEVVVDEGYRKDFQALNNILESAATLKKTDTKTPVTPIKEKITGMEISPMKFAWLDETQELTMNTFLDVCQLQEIQEKQHNLLHGFTPQKGVQDISQKTVSIEQDLVQKDPALPIYHSGDTSHGAFELKFEGSNPEKSKDGFFAT